MEGAAALPEPLRLATVAGGGAVRSSVGGGGSEGAPALLEEDWLALPELAEDEAVVAPEEDAEEGESDDSEGAPDADPEEAPPPDLDGEADGVPEVDPSFREAVAS